MTLLVPDSMKDPVRIFHKSFPDFLMDSKRCVDHQFFVDPSIYHRLSQRDLVFMSQCDEKRVKEEHLQPGEFYPSE